jgi:lysophospholipase L1-like esterase
MGDEFFVVAALGDSLTRGYRMRDPFAMDPRVPYPAQLEMLLRVKLGRMVFVVNAGVNADLTEGMIGRFNVDVASERPDAIVVWGGINDLGHARKPEHVMANLAKLYGMCTEIKAIPIGCTLAPTRYTSTAMLQLNDMIRAYASDKGIILADLYPAFADAEGNLRQEYSDDGAHLTFEGYRRVAEVVLDALTPILPKKSPDQ